MKELSTNYTLRNGETKLITVKLEDDLADWLVTQPEEVYKDFLIFDIFVGLQSKLAVQADKGKNS
mgnify:CR=1 FL=1